LLRAATNWHLQRDKPLPARLRHFYIIDIYDKAIREYDAGVYHGPITVFKAEASSGAEHMGWARKEPSSLEVRVVPGDHYNVVKEPQVKALAMELGRSIEKALGQRAAAAI